MYSDPRSSTNGMPAERRASANPIDMVPPNANDLVSPSLRSITGRIGRPNFSANCEVALVVRGHGHDRARAVRHQHVVRDPDRDARAVHRD